VDERILHWLDTLGVALLWGAVAVLGLSLIAAIAIAGSESSIPGVDELQHDNRGVFAVVTIAGGLTSAGLLAGIGALVRLRVAEHREAAIERLPDIRSRS